MSGAWGQAWSTYWGGSWGSVSGAVGATFQDYSESNADAETHASNLLICDRSGFRVKPQEGLVREWSGQQVIDRFAEPRHDQDFVRAKGTDSRGGSRAPEGPDDFVGTNEITADDL